MTETREDGSELDLITTAAHNFENNLNGKLIISEDITFSNMKNGDESYSDYEVLKYFVHPNYHEYGGKPDCGFDFALAFLKPKPNGMKNWDDKHYNFKIVENMLIFQFNSMIARQAINSELAITGYPGEKKKRKYMYRSEGKMFEVIDTKGGGLCAVYTNFTTKGTSGSAVRSVS